MTIDGVSKVGDAGRSGTTDQLIRECENDGDIGLLTVGRRPVRVKWV